MSSGHSDQEDWAMVGICHPILLGGGGERCPPGDLSCGNNKLGTENEKPVGPIIIRQAWNKGEKRCGRKAQD